MENIMEAAKRVLLKLNEIQPAMSGAGLDYESDLVREMRQDLAVVIWGGKPDPVVVAKVLESQFSDVMASMDYFLVTLEALGKLNSDTLRNSDRFASLLQLAMCSAENFAARSGEFIASKQSFQQVFGGNHVTN